ncbi:MAG: DUF2845 domain-containing protein [Woeseiaceae bacterium]
MSIPISRLTIAIAGIALSLLIPEPAEAFRCGTRLVKDDMHEAEVVAICGDPEIRRDLGYVPRNYDIRSRHRLGYGWTEYRVNGHSYLSQEVVVTEYIYNLGPRKKMRRLIFEGGLLVRIERLGYGYHKK